MMDAYKKLQDQIDELTFENKELYDTITTLILNIKKLEDENIELKEKMIDMKPKTVSDYF